jgi:hypothetical protein
MMLEKGGQSTWAKNTECPVAQRGVLALFFRSCRRAVRAVHYEVIDFLAVLFGYAVSGERTLEAFYERLHPFAPAFMALFGRDCLPARSTLSRFLAALTPEAVEALRAVSRRPARATSQTSSSNPASVLVCNLVELQECSRKLQIVLHV